jgi:hypothetical protein
MRRDWLWHSLDVARWLGIVSCGVVGARFTWSDHWAVLSIVGLSLASGACSYIADQRLVRLNTPKPLSISLKCDGTDLAGSLELIDRALAKLQALHERRGA